MEALRSEMQHRDEMQRRAILHLSEKLDFANVTERLASIEARLPRN